MHLNEDLIWKATANDDLTDIINALFLKSDEEPEVRLGGSRLGPTNVLERWWECFQAEILKLYLIKHYTNTPDLIERRYWISCVIFWQTLQCENFCKTIFRTEARLHGKVGTVGNSEMYHGTANACVRFCCRCVWRTVNIGDPTALCCLYRFAGTVFERFVFEYFRTPNEEKRNNSFWKGEAPVDSIMILSIDPRKWVWKTAQLHFTISEKVAK